MKAVAYCRLSGRGQVEKGGFPRQEQNIRRFCKSQKMEVEKVFKEQVSGTKDENERPMFAAMVGELMANGTKAIVVESLDRLARQLVVSEQLIVFLASKGLDLYMASSGECVTKSFKEDPIKKALIQMQGIFSELDKNQLVVRLKKGRERKAQETGKPCGGAKGYGETEAEKAVIKRIQYMRRCPRGGGLGKSLKEIANQLNAELIPTKRGKRWNTGQVYAILQRRKKK